MAADTDIRPSGARARTGRIGGDWLDQPLQGLTALREAREQVDRQLWSAICQCKLGGATWEEVGRSMGLPERIVVQRYATAVAYAEQALKDFLARTEPGAAIVGRVACVTPFGVFVEVVPGVEGLVKASQTSRDLDSFSVGEAVEVEVAPFPEEKRLALLIHDGQEH